MSRWKDRLRLLFLAVLLAMAGFNLISGFSWLFDPDGGGDLRLRWTEQQYVLRHKNPFDVYEAWRAEAAVSAESPLAVETDLGPPTPGYPPWAYCTGILFMWSKDPSVVRVCFATLNLAALVFIGWWNFNLGRGRWECAFLYLGISLVADSLGATLALGQLGILVVGSLLAAYWCAGQRRPILAGLFLGVALIKPTLSLPFVLAFLIKKRWLILIVAATYTSLATGVVWALVGTDPVTMLEQMQTAAVDWNTIHYTQGADPIALLSQIGVAPRFALPLATVLSTAIALALMWFWRRASLMTLFAIAAVTARLWVAHYHYDDVIVLFVLFGLVEILAKRFSFGAAAAYGALTVALVLPSFFHVGLIWDHLSWRLGDVGNALVLLCQVGALAVLLVTSSRNTAANEPERSNFASSAGGK